MMNLEKIKNAKTKYLGKNCIYFSEIGSTQDYAKNANQEELPNGTIILAEYQTKGKGTKDRKWLSSKGKNITMTIVYYPNENISKFKDLTINIANAIKKAIYELYGYSLSIKMPNDLYLNGKKLAGILTESVILNEKVIKLFVGIGFNVNEENFESEIENVATSLKKEFRKEFEREKIIEKILEEIEKVLIL